MICQLCQKEKRLVKAHIIPKWAYAYLYPSGKVKGDPLMFISTSEQHKRSYIGLYDSEILCKSCDNFLGKFDEYGRKIFLNTPLIELSNLNNMAYILRGVDTIKIRFFILSVLWRASISKREEISSIDLGPYERKLRDLLYKVYENNIVAAKSDLDTFPLLICKFDGGEFPDLVDKNMQMPFLTKIDGVNFNILYFPRGFKIFIKADKRPLPTSLAKLTITRDEVIIPKLQEFQKSKEFRIMMNALDKRINFPDV
jgi:hypothetical protein